MSELATPILKLDNIHENSPLMVYKDYFAVNVELVNCLSLRHTPPRYL